MTSPTDILGTELKTTLAQNSRVVLTNGCSARQCSPSLNDISCTTRPVILGPAASVLCLQEYSNIGIFHQLGWLFKIGTKSMKFETPDQIDRCCDPNKFIFNLPRGRRPADHGRYLLRHPSQ